MKKMALILLCSISTVFAQQKSVENKAVKAAVVAFLKWYKTGYKGFNKYTLYKPTTANSEGPPYTIHTANVAKHFAWIKANAPLFATAFIDNEKLYFDYCNLKFKEQPSEEIAIGFDYDRILNSQESPAITINNTWFNKATQWEVQFITPTKAEVMISEKVRSEDAASSRFLMVKENGNWKVALPPGMIDVPPFVKESTQ